MFRVIIKHFSFRTLYLNNINFFNHGTVMSCSGLINIFFHNTDGLCITKHDFDNNRVVTNRQG